MANIINFNDDKDQTKEQGQSNLTQGSSGTSASISPVGGGQQSASPVGPTAPGSASSGKFTNIQKYISANKGAGQQVASGINKQQDKSLKSGQISQQDEAKKFQAGVQSANETLGRGQNYLNQINQNVDFSSTIPTQGAQPQQVPATGNTVTAQAIEENPLVQPQQQPTAGFNVQDFVSDANRLADFSKLRQSQGIDEIALKTQAEKARDLAGQNQLQAQDLSNRSKTEAGRFGLLGDAFSRSNYTQGQKRLDNLFLTASGNKDIESIQNKANQNINKAKDVYNQSQAGVSQSDTIKQNESDLANKLQNRSNELETGYIDALQNSVAGINAARDAERAKYQDFTQRLINTGKNESWDYLDPNLFNESGLVEGEHVFNYFQNPNLDKNQWLNLNRNANDYRDIATQKNLNYYDALSKLAGIDNSKLNALGALVDANTGELNRAAQFKSGEGSLRADLDKLQNDFIQKALSTNISATGTDSGSRSLLGGGSDAGVTLTANLADYLGKNNLDNISSAKVNAERLNLAQLAPNLTQQGLMSNIAGQVLGNAVGGMAGGSISALGNLPGNIAGSVASGLGLTGGSGSSTAAAARARQSLLNDLTNYLQGQGYNNYMTKFGNRSTSDLAYKNLANETDRLSLRNDTGYYTGRANEGQQMSDEGNINQRQAQIAEDIRNRLGLPKK